MRMCNEKLMPKEEINCHLLPIIQEGVDPPTGNCVCERFVSVYLTGSTVSPCELQTMNHLQGIDLQKA